MSIDKYSQNDEVFNNLSSVSIADEDEEYILRPKVQPITTAKQDTQIMQMLKKYQIVAFIVFVVVLMMLFRTQADSQQPVTKSMVDFIKQALSKVQKQNPATYLQVELVKPYKQLPICLLLFPTSQQKSPKIWKSIQNQNYTNYAIVKFKSQELTYSAISHKIQNQCLPYSIIMFIENQMKDTALNLTNYYYQMYNMWIGYSDTAQHNLQIVSMYYRIWEMVANNDFWEDFVKSKNQLLNKETVMANLISILLQLCRFNAKKTPYLHYFTQDTIQLMQTSLNPLQSPMVTRVPFQPLFSLQQNYKIDLETTLKHRQQFRLSNTTLLFPDLFKRSTNQVTHYQFQQLLQSEQIIFLSKNHSLCDIDRLRIERKYRISRYAAKEKQLPLCVFISSYNNEQNDRANKVIRSIVRQQYENFHIVFVDDHSNDRTLQRTVQQLNRFNFPKERVTLVRNLKQKRATYNYINSNFMHCKQNDIQMIIDGDDQLIGQQVFNFVNTQYQDDPNLWFMHTIYKNTQYQEGFNLLPLTKDFVFNWRGGRRFIFFISHLRTWKVKLYRSIPMSEHISPLTGTLHDTNCDVALQYGLFQMSNGEQHAKYVPQINYLYIYGYGNNDDSTIFKLLRVNLHHFLLSLRPRLKPLQNLQQQWENSEVKDLVERDKNIEYIVLNMEDVGRQL